METVPVGIQWRTGHSVPLSAEWELVDFDAIDNVGGRRAAHEDRRHPSLRVVPSDTGKLVDDAPSIDVRALSPLRRFLTPWSTPTLPPRPDAERARLGAAWAAQDAIEETSGDGFDEAHAAAMAGLRVKARTVA